MLEFSHFLRGLILASKTVTLGRESWKQLWEDCSMSRTQL